MLGARLFKQACFYAKIWYYLLLLLDIILFITSIKLEFVIALVNVTRAHYMSTTAEKIMNQ